MVMYRLRLVLVLGIEAAALIGLLHLGRRPWLRIDWSDLGTWLRVTPTEDALAALVWLAALGCVVWLTGSTLLYLVARASRVPALIRSVEWMTLPAIRRVTEGALAAVLALVLRDRGPERTRAPLLAAAQAGRRGERQTADLADGEVEPRRPLLEVEGRGGLVDDARVAE